MQVPTSLSGKQPSSRWRSLLGSGSAPGKIIVHRLRGFYQRYMEPSGVDTKCTAWCRTHRLRKSGGKSGMFQRIGLSDAKSEPVIFSALFGILSWIELRRNFWTWAARGGGSTPAFADIVIVLADAAVLHERRKQCTPSGREDDGMAPAAYTWRPAPIRPH